MNLFFFLSENKSVKTEPQNLPFLETGYSSIPGFAFRPLIRSATSVDYAERPQGTLMGLDCADFGQKRAVFHLQGVGFPQ